MSRSTLNLLSQTTEYALRALVLLASAEGEIFSTQQIAEATQVKREYLSKVLQGLRRAELVFARPGVGGGFRLARPPAEITVLEVVESVDPFVRHSQCPLKLVSHQAQLCLLHERLDSATNAVETTFRETTIEDLVPNRPRKSKRCPFPIRPQTNSTV